MRSSNILNLKYLLQIMGSVVEVNWPISNDQDIHVIQQILTKIAMNDLGLRPEEFTIELARVEKLTLVCVMYFHYDNLPDENKDSNKLQKILKDAIDRIIEGRSLRNPPTFKIWNSPNNQKSKEMVMTQFQINSNTKVSTSIEILNDASTPLALSSLHNYFLGNQKYLLITDPYLELGDSSSEIITFTWSPRTSTPDLLKGSKSELLQEFNTHLENMFESMNIDAAITGHTFDWAGGSEVESKYPVEHKNPYGFTGAFARFHKHLILSPNMGDLLTVLLLPTAGFEKILNKRTQEDTWERGVYIYANRRNHAVLIYRGVSVTFDPVRTYPDWKVAEDNKDEIEDMLVILRYLNETLAS